MTIFCAHPNLKRLLSIILNILGVSTCFLTGHLKNSTLIQSVDMAKDTTQPGSHPCQALQLQNILNKQTQGQLALIRAPPTILSQSTSYSQYSFYIQVCVYGILFDCNCCFVFYFFFNCDLISFFLHCAHTYASTCMDLLLNFLILTIKAFYYNLLIVSCLFYCYLIHGF